MFIAILGILDIIAGGLLMLNGVISLEASTFVLYLMIIMFLKSVYSIGSAVANGFFFDFMGYLDLISAILLLLAFWGISFDPFFWVGLLILVKGIYSVLVTFAMS